MSNAALEIDGLSSGYGATQVLRNVTLSVPAGSAIALLGPNGAGKTTLLRAVSGFLPATEGRVLVSGEDVTTLAAHKRFRRGVCLIPEGRGVFHGLTVQENLTLQVGTGSEAEAMDRAVSAFPILGERMAQTAGTLSGGQQQMLAMAAAYVRRPNLVLVDEASLGLAPIVVDEIFTFLAQLVREGSALLLIDQFITRALALADTVYVLRRGSIVHGGPASEITREELYDHYLGRDGDRAAGAVAGG